MSKYKVYVTRKLPGSAINKLKKEFEVKMNNYDRALTSKELKEETKEVDGLLCLLTDTIDAELLENNPDLKVIANYAVGYNNIDINACTKKNIKVSNTPGVLTDTTADFTWSLIMSIARRITEADHFTRKNKFEGWSPTMFLGGDIYGKTLGLIGLGRIGQAVAKRAKGFDMEVYYYDVNRLDEKTEENLGLKYKDFDSLLKESDFISIHVPLIKETKHLIDKKQFEIMKETAYLINTARGPIINEKELVYALKSGEIAGAALDVFEDEPKIIQELFSLNNTVLTPHIASASIETRTKMADIAVENLIAGLKGEKMPNLLNEKALTNKKINN